MPDDDIERRKQEERRREQAEAERARELERLRKATEETRNLLGDKDKRDRREGADDE